MRVSPDKNSIRSFIYLYKGETAKALFKTYQPIIDKAHVTPVEDLKRVVPFLLKSDHLEEVLKSLYSKVPADFASNMVKKIRAKKEENWIDMFRFYAHERTKKIIRQIMTTQEENVNITIDRVVTRMTAEGASIEGVRQGLQDELLNDLVNIADWEARRIAQTEVIGSANYGSYEGAMSEGIEGMKKAWITSGNSNVRDSHNEYQGLGEQDMDYEYAPGLKFPGDPECDDPSEIINCHCTIVYAFND